jgi:hypothetical protein
MLGAGVLVAALVAHARTLRGETFAAGATAACIALAVLEFVPRPIAHFPYDRWLSPFYARLAADSTRDYAIVDVPVDFRDPRGGADIYEYAQIVHRKPMVGGYVSREPRAVFRTLDASAFLQSLQQRAYADSPELELGDAGLADAERTLDRLGIGWVLVHRPLLPESEWLRVNRWLARVMGPPSYEDRWLSAYRWPPP